MQANRGIDPLHSAPRDGGKMVGMRTDLVSMLMPFFPEDKGLTRFETEVDGYKLTVSCDQDGMTLATSTDRKILTLLAGTVARHIRAGNPPTRHIEMDTHAVLEALHGDNVIGGSDYQRIVERMNRLMATVIETEMPLGDDIARRRRFRWIDAFEHDARDTANGRRIISMRVSISEDAFLWMTRSLGFDIARRNYRKITASRSSVWRIYEVCLAHLLRHGDPARISIADLRRRVPIASELKIFKSRTLKGAMETIAKTAEMSHHVSLTLERQTEDGFEAIPFSRRTRLESLYVRIRPGSHGLPALDCILPETPGTLPRRLPDAGRKENLMT